MINDYSEITATIKPKMAKLDDLLERKKYDEAHKLILNLQADFRILDLFIQQKVKGATK